MNVHGVHIFKSVSLNMLIQIYAEIATLSTLMGFGGLKMSEKLPTFLNAKPTILCLV